MRFGLTSLGSALRRLVVPLGLIALAILTAASAVLAANAFAFDIATWHTGTRFVRTGLAPARVDAGLPWVGWHSPDGAVDDLQGYYLEGEFYTEAPCVVVLPQPVPSPGWTPAGTFNYKTYLVLGTSTLYAYYTHASGCRTGSPPAGT
jgi:hypothetical protein